MQYCMQQLCNVHSAMRTHMKKSDSFVGYIKFGKTIAKDWSGKGSISKM